MHVVAGVHALARPCACYHSRAGFESLVGGDPLYARSICWLNPLVVIYVATYRSGLGAVLESNAIPAIDRLRHVLQQSTKDGQLEAGTTLGAYAEMA